MEIIRFIFETPANFVGTVVLLLIGLSALKLVALIVAALAEGIAGIRLVEVNHNHYGESKHDHCCCKTTEGGRGDGTDT